MGIPRRGVAQTNSGLPLVGVLFPGTPDAAKGRIAALRLGLQEAGFIEGTNYLFAIRIANGDFSRLPSLAEELGKLKLRVIVTAGTALVARKFFPDTPMVFTGFAIDPIATGLAQSYVRPGGMATGNVTNAIGGEEALTEKRMGFFKEIVPNVTRLGMIGPQGPVSSAEQSALRNLSGRLGFEFTNYVIPTIDDLESAFASGRRDGMNALYISGEPLLLTNISRVMPHVIASGMPALGAYPEWGRAGLLMSYSSDLLDGFRHAGTYVAKILGGAKPGDLPIEQASKFTFVINLQTAKTLNVAVTPHLLSLADEVIE